MMDQTDGNGVQVPVIPTHSPIEALLDLSPMVCCCSTWQLAAAIRELLAARWKHVESGLRLIWYHLFV
ncbi:hypothetical protein NC651_034705 [Populus alba x Populus x berolinensis]|nr:hypothetical protein NC651_034705 [Populus alba x Populus x berolinensis]